MGHTDIDYCLQYFGLLTLWLEHCSFSNGRIKIWITSRKTFNQSDFVKKLSLVLPDFEIKMGPRIYAALKTVSVDPKSVQVHLQKLKIFHNIFYSRV